jgi:hypothetical protein
MALELTNGSFGTTVRRTIVDQSGAVVDVSNATLQKLYLKPPSGSVKTVQLTLTNGGTDGVVHYVIATGVLDETGPWRLQVRITSSSPVFDLTSVEEDWIQVRERFV